MFSLVSGTVPNAQLHEPVKPFFFKGNIISSSKGNPQHFLAIQFWYEPALLSLFRKNVTPSQNVYVHLIPAYGQ